jgi:hypothetical protein
MLRLTVLLLLLANAVYYAWSHGFLAATGLEPTRQTEPQRLQQQIKPDALRIVPIDDARRVESPSASAGARGTECLLAGLFEEPQAASLRQALESWPAGSWSLESAVEPARWIVYMGKYLTLENVSRKKAELRQMGVSFEAVTNPSLEPGLSLGGFTTQAAATEHMEALSQRGIRTAKVTQERPEARGQMLKLAAVDDSLRARLEDIKPALNGKNLRPCR